MIRGHYLHMKPPRLFAEKVIFGVPIMMWHLNICNLDEYFGVSRDFQF